MSYRVLIPEAVEKELQKLPAQIEGIIHRRLSDLEVIPRPAGARKMKARKGWRIRVGDYRVLYEIDDKNQVVRIYRIRHRREVYR
jgi:mRNA interferase RelE/StbE